ncbi:MAG: type II secretion system protein [Phycisphaerales bacterium]
MKFCDSPQTRSVRGFSLIEVLVVIAIVALLISFTAPALMKSRNAARAVLCSARMTQVYGVLQMYQADNREMFPRLQDPSYGVCTPDFDPGVSLDKTWVNLLCDKGYIDASIEAVGVPAEFRCPDAIGYDNDPSWAGHMPHFGANYFINPPPALTATIGARSFRGRPLSYPGNTASKIMLVDSRHLTNNRGWFGAGAITWIGFRHEGANAANVVNFDGHVQLQRKFPGVPISDPRHPFASVNFAR